MATERLGLPGQVGQKMGTRMTGEGSKDPQQIFALCMRVKGELMELCLEMGDGSAGSCWVTLREQSNAGGAVVNIYHRLTVKEKGDEADGFLLWTAGISHSTEGDFFSCV